MAEICPRPRVVKIILVIGCFFSISAIVCFAVGTPLYFQDRNKILLYEKNSCIVRSATYEVIRGCIVDTTKNLRTEKCYLPIWHVDLGNDGTVKGTVQADAERSYSAVEVKTNQYKVGNSYPCWHNKKKPTEVVWFVPTLGPSFILFIIGGICIPFAIIFLIIFFRVRERPDL